MCTTALSSASRSSRCRFSSMYAVTRRSLHSGRSPSVRSATALVTGRPCGMPPIGVTSTTLVSRTRRLPRWGCVQRGHDVAELLSQKQPGAVHARLHEGDAETQGLRDLAIRQALDVAQHQHGPGRSGQHVDCRSERQPQFGLDRSVVHARRPVGRGPDVAAPLIEERQHLVQGHVSTLPPPAAEFLVGRIRHDAVEPGAEGRLTPEGIDLPDHAPERVLHDFLCIRSVPRDPHGQAVRALPVRGEQALCRCRLASPQRFQEREIPVGTPSIRDGARVGFENHLKTHLHPPRRELASTHSRTPWCQARSSSGKRLPYVGRDGSLPAEVIPSLEARRTSSATDPACILCITCPRCSLTVTSLVPNSPAICLLSRPATTPLSTSRSRGVREAYRRRSSVSSWRSPRSARSRSIAFRMASSRSWSRNGFVRNSTAPAFMARTDMGMSPWPVRKMIGSAASVSASSRWRSSPLSPGRRTSSTRHPGASGRRARRNAWAVGKTSTPSPTELMSLRRPSRTAASSATTTTIGEPGVTESPAERSETSRRDWGSVSPRAVPHALR